MMPKSSNFFLKKGKRQLRYYFLAVPSLPTPSAGVAPTSLHVDLDHPHLALGGGQESQQGQGAEWSAIPGASTVSAVTRTRAGQS